MIGVSEKLIVHWRASGITITAGNSELQIREFERQNQVKLPSDFREYFLTLNGMKPGLYDGEDSEGFSFWELARVRTITEEYVRVGMENDYPASESFFIFADYLQWSWAYAIRLSLNLSESGSVILAGYEHPVIVAASFSEFVDLYLADSAKLYGVTD